MSKRGGQGVFSPLENAGGTTAIAETVVSQIAGIAAGEVGGIYLGGSTTRRAGGMLDRAKSSSAKTREMDKSRGVSAEVGSAEAAVDLKMGLEDGVDLPELTAKVRSKVVNRIENLVGLAVTEVNLTITDIASPEARNHSKGGTADRASGNSFAGEDEAVGADRVPDGPPGTREGGVKRVEPNSRTHTESKSGPVPEEEVRVEQVPVSENEIAELDVVEGEVEKQPSERRDRRDEKPNS